MTQAQVEEALVTLYLRLNGYFTSGFIVHSELQIRTQVDVMAVRFPFSREPERGVGPAHELDPSDEFTDILIGEVKGRGPQLQFNEALRKPEAVARMLRWIGLFEDEEIPELVGRVLGALDPSPGAETPPTVLGPRNTRIRALLFCPECSKRRKNQAFFLPGPPLFDYIWRCFRPPEPRESCSVRYDFGAWGLGLEAIVRYFKDESRVEPGTFEELRELMTAGST